MDGIVAVEFGFFEGQQVILFDKDLDAAGEVVQADAADKDTVEGLDEKARSKPGVMGARCIAATASAAMTTWLILPITVLRNCTLGGRGRRGGLQPSPGGFGPRGYCFRRRIRRRPGLLADAFGDEGRDAVLSCIVVANGGQGRGDFGRFGEGGEQGARSCSALGL